MNNYETAPATRLLATKCAVCGRPLVDAQSVEVGVGPECRKRNGLEQENPNRDEANRIVHRLALFRSQHELAPPAEAVVEMLGQLVKLGYVKLSGVLAERLASIVITVHQNESLLLRVSLPFKQTSAAKLGAVRWARQGYRVWETGHTMRWFVQSWAKQDLWKLLREEYPGMLGVGPLGPFAIKERAKPVQTEMDMKMPA